MNNQMNHPQTRKKTSIWLIGHGQGVEEISQNVLPTKLEVLRTFFFFHKYQNNTVNESATLLANQIIFVWNKARIPTALRHNIVKQIHGLFNKYVALKKNCTRKDVRQKQKEAVFSCDIKNLFDVSHKDWKNIINNPEDIKFFIDQKGERKMAMGSVDVKQSKKEKRTEDRKAAFEKRKETEKLRISKVK